MFAEPWVSVDELAGLLGLANDSVHRWIDKKGLTAHEMGRSWKFKVSEVDVWVRDWGAAQDGEHGHAVSGEPVKE